MPHRNNVTIRPAEKADIADLARVQLISALDGFAHIFPPSIPKPTQQTLEAEWARVIEDDIHRVFVAESGGVVLGAMAIGRREYRPVGTDCCLRRLYVEPDAAGSGIGSMLHDRAVVELRRRGCTRAYLWVLERNISARRMYERRGWKLQPWTRSDWPGSGILELCYTLELTTI